jgi:hypothetical protein
LERRLATLQVATRPENPVRPVDGHDHSSFEGTAPAAASVEQAAPVAADSTRESPEPSSNVKVVAPPNFDELRNLMIPKPARKFVPPGREKSADGHGSSSAASKE